MVRAVVVVEQGLEVRLVGDMAPLEPGRDHVGQPAAARRQTGRYRRTTPIPCRGPTPSAGPFGAADRRTKTRCACENSSLKTGCVRLPTLESPERPCARPACGVGGLGTTGVGTVPGRGWRPHPGRRSADAPGAPRQASPRRLREATTLASQAARSVTGQCSPETSTIHSLSRLLMGKADHPQGGLDDRPASPFDGCPVHEMDASGRIARSKAQGRP